jgi:hypothetical protein
MTTKWVLSVDPGKATGLALFGYETGGQPELLWSAEVQQEEYAKPIRQYLNLYEGQSDGIEVVCERFTINAQTVRNSQAPYSLEQIGILKQCLMDVGRAPDDIYFQSPADAKAMFPNEALKKLGFWHKGGEGHAQDAIRHGLLRLVKSGWKPLDLLK